MRLESPAYEAYRAVVTGKATPEKARDNQLYEEALVAQRRKREAEANQTLIGAIFVLLLGIIFLPVDRR